MPRLPPVLSPTRTAKTSRTPVRQRLTLPAAEMRAALAAAKKHGLTLSEYVTARDLAAKRQKKAAANAEYRSANRQKILATQSTYRSAKRAEKAADEFISVLRNTETVRKSLTLK